MLPFPPLRETVWTGGTQVLDINLLKGRAAEAFVENVFEQAGYRVSRVGRESHVQHMLKTGRSEFIPDFLAWKPAGRSADGSSLHRLLCIEVKYRSNIGAFLALHGPELLARVGHGWPDLQIVIVTDHPDPHRSCFQLVEVPAAPGAAFGTVDLHGAPGLQIAKATCDEYEDLVRRTFAVLGAPSREEAAPRKPAAKIVRGGGVPLPAPFSGLAAAPDRAPAGGAPCLSRSVVV